MHLTPLPLAALRRHPANAREKGECSKAELADLAASIQEHGLLQPLVVRKDADDYTILAGHRRHAALLLLGVKEAPCVVLEGDEQEALAVLLTENAQHRPVSPLKEAEAVRALVEGFAGQKHPFDRAAQVLSKSVAWVRARLRLVSLSAAWRKAHADPGSPVREFPVGHLELVAALPGDLQDRILSEYENSFREGVPLAEDLRGLLAQFTRGLSKVPWDVSAPEVVPGAPPCASCPRRDSAEGGLFAGANDATDDRCLDPACFAKKKSAVVLRKVEEARRKHGDALRAERSWSCDDVALPEGTKVHREHDLVPRSKKDGGFPVLRLSTMGVVFMAEAHERAAPVTTQGDAPEAPKEKTPEEKRAQLAKRRSVRALEVFRAALLGEEADVGTEKHPMTVKPPAPQVPSLGDLLALVLAYGTGPGVGGDDARIGVYADAADLKDLLADGRRQDEASLLLVRSRLWSRVREPIARTLKTLGPLTPEAVERLVSEAKQVAALCGLDWEKDFQAPAARAMPEPRAWRAA